MALWEVPLCALPSDKSSFPRERGAAAAKAGWGPRKSRGPDSQADSVGVFVCMYVFRTYVREHQMKLNLNACLGLWGLRTHKPRANLELSIKSKTDVKMKTYHIT